MTVLFTGGDKPLGGWSLEEYDAIEQLIADGELCRANGLPHAWEEQEDEYGRFKLCSKCGEER